MQYWINQNGTQAGPVTREELEKMAITANAYVWRSGLDDWVEITELPEVADLVGNNQPIVEEPEPVAEPETEEPIVTDELQQGEETIPPIPEGEEPAAAEPQRAYTRPMQQLEGQPMPECPPTNLVWAIIATLLCCTPLGVVAIVYAAMVKSKYNQGDYAGAKRCSETSAWWCIASIVLDLALSPLVMALMMMGS
ncbi:MAG: CD225/dispanin family protein [Bacteroidales bacterium]|nr:CD225/dispanin family protein [Candidatus Sodaliphilus aphodohippi]